jgi:MoxR-like ATPase
VTFGDRELDSRAPLGECSATGKGAGQSERQNPMTTETTNPVGASSEIPATIRLKNEGGDRYRVRILKPEWWVSHDENAQGRWKIEGQIRGQAFVARNFRTLASTKRYIERVLKGEVQPQLGAEAAPAAPAITSSPEQAEAIQAAAAKAAAEVTEKKAAEIQAAVLGTAIQAPIATAAGARAAFTALQDELNASFPERREVIEGALLAVLAGEHVLMLGPPGTAKSALVRAIASAFSGAYFERLMTKFTTPEELFGALSLDALKQGRYQRITSGQLPEAEFGFVDEVFKGNSAILNNLLTLMNERLFHNDGRALRCPLVSLFGASNEMPESKELDAMFDRFLVRFQVDYIARDTNFEQILLAPEPGASVQLSMEMLREAQAEVAQVKVSKATVAALLSIREQLKANDSIVASDRRWKKTLKLAQAAAWMAGDVETAPEHLSIITDALWSEPKARAKIAPVVARFADPVTAKADEIVSAASEAFNTAMALKANPAAFVARASRALSDLRAQFKALGSLADGAGSRGKAKIAAAQAEIQGKAEELKRAASKGLGL